MWKSGEDAIDEAVDGEYHADENEDSEEVTNAAAHVLDTVGADLSGFCET